MAEFGRRGFSAGSLNVIAREARIAKGSLFQYFDDKLDLFTVTCAEVSDRARDAVLGGVDLGASFFAVLHDITDRWLDYFGAHPLERGIAFAAAHEMDPAAGAAVRSVTNAKFVDALQPLVKQAADDGDFAPHVDPNEVLAMVVLVLRHLDSAPFVSHLDPILGLHDRPPDEVRTIARRLVTAVSRAYAADPEPFAPGPEGTI
jgi:AcrR family transcriptional regulator